MSRRIFSRIMATYNHWGATVPGTRLPLTPPEYSNYYLTLPNVVPDEADKFYGAPRSYSARTGQPLRNHGPRYEQLPAYSVRRPLTQSKRATVDYSLAYSTAMPPQYQYHSSQPPILPPIHVPDDVNYGYPHSHSHSHSEVKQEEEKPTGGVAQHLDYEMDFMSDFVAEKCQMVVCRTPNPTPQFRKYVVQILSSTRLPSSTIMLGLFYLQERMKIEAAKGRDLNRFSLLTRMLTVCLLLGSKFLDDNTFQNRSWAEVSSIPVCELNKMELEWLDGFNWEIHGMIDDDMEGLDVWIEHWHAYEHDKKAAKLEKAHKLAPINTDITRVPPIQQPLVSPDGPIPPQYQQGSRYDAAWARPHVSEYSPPSAPYSGPTTPEYYNHWHHGGMINGYSRASWAGPNKSSYDSQRAPAGPYDMPYYGAMYAPINTWSPHSQHCSCLQCAKQSQYYHIDAAGFPIQSVMG